MSKPNHPRMTPEQGASGTPHSDIPDSEREIRSADTKGAKTTTVFGALFGAAAVAPT